MKTNRLVLAGKMIRAQLRRQQHPNAVIRIRLDGVMQDDSAIYGVMIFIVTYMLALLVGTVFATLCGVDLLTGFSSTVACLGNVARASAMSTRWATTPEYRRRSRRSMPC